jgi:hypothetical protein
LQIAGNDRVYIGGAAANTKRLHITPAAVTSNTASTELLGFHYDNYGKQWSTGALSSQREFYIQSTTYSFAAASIITDAFQFYVDSVTAGTNATITNNYAAGFNGDVLMLNSLVMGTTALSVSSTSGFLYLSSCGGTPSGVPVSKSGTIPTVYDTLNDKLYFYNGSWKTQAGGTSGGSGTQGFQGWQGASGADGSAGFQGFQGAQGFQGFQGASSAYYTQVPPAPSSPNVGDRWYDLSTGLEFVYIDDGNSSQWVSPAGGGGGTGSTVSANYLIIYRRLTASAALDSTDLSTVNAGNPLVIEMNVATANTLTVPLNATIGFTIGSQITVSQYGSGQTTIAAEAGVTLRSSGSFLKLAAQYSMATLMKVGTNEWYVVGQLAP